MAKANVGYHAEKLVARLLGLKPVAFSGSRWQAGKEDGECTHFLMQHKSTSAKSISVNAQDVDTLLSNALVVHKHPLFVIDFIRNLIQKPNETPAIKLLCIPFSNPGDIGSFCREWVAHEENCLQSDTRRGENM